MATEFPREASRRPDALALDAFVPALIRRRVALNQPPTEPIIERRQAALLLADLAGFSTLAENFSRRGPRGAEDLKDLLNLFFGRLVDIVNAHGGQVLKFPGDATLALWPAEEGDVLSAVHRAAQCAIEAQQALVHIDTLGVRLHMRVGIGVGDVWVATVGGVSGRWELLVAGDPLTQATQSMSAADPGDVVVSSAVHRQLATNAQTTGVADGAFRIDSIAAPPPLAPDDPIAVEVAGSSILRAYVPRSVQARLDAGQTDWLAEFRRVSVLFIRLGLNVAGDGMLDLQRGMVAVQTAVYRYGGSINQMLADDKGIVVVCGWGLALHAHVDDEVRAARAALDLRSELKDLGIGGSFGLATGEVFTGLRGNHRRCEYAMIGDVVNVAARLMQAARGDILCDLASCEGAARKIEFEALPAIRVKGRERPVDVYRPIQLSTSGPSETAIVGRAQERRALRDRLEALVAGAHGGVVIVEGHAGIGKSRLISDLIERAVARGVRVVVAAGDEIERLTPYHPWRAVFDNLLGFDDVTDRGVLGRRVLALVESDTRLLPFASLLNPVLRLNLAETEWSERVPPRGRAVLTRDLLIHLLRCVTPNHSTLLVLEDAHWFDSASWALAEGVERELRDVLLLVATRPIAHEEKPPELVTLGAQDGALVLRLDGLAPDETRALVCQQLRARVLSEPVARLIREKAEGHPFFAEELAHALRDRGLVEVEGGVCRFTVAAAIPSVQLPNTVQVVIKSRIDQLSVPQQLTVKVASVLGRSFDLMSLRGAYPITVNDSDLHGHLQRLVERDLVHVSESDSVPTFVFKHAITQEVAYSLLPFALRRQLHAAVARGSERQHSSDLARVYPLLAYHWSRAEVAERALFYLDKAGEQALGRHASEEALRFFRDAVDIDEKSTDEALPGPSVAVGRRLFSPSDVRRIRWYRRLGDASINLGRWDEGRTYFEQSLKLIGLPLPDSDRAWALGLGAQVLVQCARRLAPRFARSFGAPELLQEAVCAYGRVGSTSYHYGRMIQVLYSLFAALNQAERLAPTIELALARADVGNILGLAPLRPLARVYHRLATQTANQLDDPVIVAKILARSAVYQLGIGNWKACRNLDAAMSLCDQVGDTYAWEENAAIRSRAAHLIGEFELAARLGAELRTRARASGSLAHEIWGFDTEVWGVLYQGQTDTALELAEHGLQLVTTAPHTDRLALLDLLAAKALAHLHRTELDHAWQAASRIVEVMAKAPRPRYFALPYMTGAVEVCLARWEGEGTSREAVEAETYVWRLCRNIEQYARINPSARARGLLARGCAEWLAGRQQAAQATWRRALAAAERFGLPYEIARVHEEIGRRLAPDDVSGRRHLVKAIEGYRRLKAATDLKRAKGRLAARPAVASVVW